MTVSQGFTVDVRMDCDAAFELAAERGFDFVELDMDGAFERQHVDIETVRSLTSEYGLDLLVHLPYRFDPASPHEHVREGAVRELRAAIDTAVELGAEKGVFHATSMAHAEKWDHGQIRDYIFETVRRVHDHASERGFEAVAENLKPPFFDAGNFPELFRRTDANACLDTGHAHVTGQDAEAQADLLREHGDRIGHVHLNDTRRDDTDEHLPVGFGNFDFEALADAMKETNWSGTCTHEIGSTNPEYAAKGKAEFDGLITN